MKKKNKQLNAFTLAEVLITLGIIGVVAAVTMPTLVKNYQKKETVTKLKRAYAEIQQVIKMSESEHGEMSGWGVASTADATERQQFVEEYIVKYFKPLKKCVPATEECFKRPIGLNGNYVIGVYQEKYVAFVSTNGMSYLFWIRATGNGGWIYVDIDGPNKGSSVLGKDIFVFMMQYDRDFELNIPPSGTVIEQIGVFPLGLGLKRYKLNRDELISVDTEYTILNGYKCSKAYGGQLCGALIITDGWEIRDDYPW